MRARDVMSGPVTIKADAAKVLVNSRFSALPIIDEKGAMTGIVSEVDLIRRVVGDEDYPTQLHAHLGDPDSQEALAAPVAQVMTREVITAGEDTPLEDIATLILKHQKKRIPIVRDGSVVGIVSRTDLVKAMLSHGAPAHAARAGSAEGRRDPAPAGRGRRTGTQHSPRRRVRRRRAQRLGPSLGPGRERGRGPGLRDCRRQGAGRHRRHEPHADRGAALQMILRAFRSSISSSL